MSNLDDKLREIVKNIVGASLGIEKPLTGSVSTSDYVPLIKQAFIDEGYLAPGQSMITNNEGTQLMLGKEWYDRYLAEIEKINLETDFVKEIRGYKKAGLKTYEAAVIFVVAKLEAAAERAAGLE